MASSNVVNTLPPPVHPQFEQRAVDAEEAKDCRVGRDHRAPCRWGQHVCSASRRISSLDRSNWTAVAIEDVRPRDRTGRAASSLMRTSASVIWPCGAVHQPPITIEARRERHREGDRSF